MENSKKYLKSNAKCVKTQYGELINVSFNIGELINLALENNSQWINVTIGERKEKNEYGSTHLVWLNEFKPKDN